VITQKIIKNKDRILALKSIVISESDINQNSLIGKFNKIRPRIKLIKHWVVAYWKNSGSMEVVPFPYEFIFFNFSNWKDKDKVIE